MPYDAILIGGGPAGLAAALTLGRACRRVLLCDAGPPRNAAATHIHNFVTRDGTPPTEFRSIGRAQLAQYETVEIRDTRVEAVSGEPDAFEVVTTSGTERAHRIVLCTGMVDETLALPGFSEAWGRSIFQCPYCHGWELRGRRWGYLAADLDRLQHGFAALLTSWTDDVVVFTNAALDISPQTSTALDRAGVRIEQRPIARLASDAGQLTHVELADGTRVPCEVLYAHPPQRHVAVVTQLGLELDDHGFVRVDPMTRQTSALGIYAAGDLTTGMQGALYAAAMGSQAAAVINLDLSSNPHAGNHHSPRPA